MTKILYERGAQEQRGDCLIELQGRGPDLLRALVQIVYAMHVNFGINVADLARDLPGLVELETETIEKTSMVDVAAIRTAKEGLE